MILTTTVLFLGAEAVGKSTLLYTLKYNKDIAPIPTEDVNIEKIKYKDRCLNIVDIGGKDKNIHLWEENLQKAKCIVYFIDISLKEELDHYINNFNSLLAILKDYNKIPIIIFGNIFNEGIQYEPEEFLKKSKLPQGIKPYIIKSNIHKKEGINELLEYIYNNIEFIEEKDEPGKEEEIEDKKAEKNKETLTVKMFGLDGAGKTVILYLLKEGNKVRTIPTIGYNLEVIDKENWEKSITIWDIGGYKPIRNLWVNHLREAQGLIWVYDISNKERIEESLNEFKKLFDNPKMEKKIPLLIYANKSDLNKNGNKVSDYLDGIKDYLKDRKYLIKECSEKDVEALKEGLDWLYMNLK